MIIRYAGREYTYDPGRIDVETAIKIKAHTGYGMRSWEQAIDDCDPVALQALLWVVRKQNGENTPIRSNFEVIEFFAAFVDGIAEELAAKAVEAAAEVAEADPTVTAETA